jgi:hypothetical protein
VIITDHAARRYIRRLAPGLSLPAARAFLARASLRATLLPQRTDAGHQLWRTEGARGAVLVVKHDPDAGPVVVTVLSEGQTREADDDEVDEVRAAFERAERAREEQRRIDEAERVEAERRNESHWDRMAREQREAAARRERGRQHYERQSEAIAMARWAGVLP